MNRSKWWGEVVRQPRIKVGFIRRGSFCAYAPTTGCEWILSEEFQDSKLVIMACLDFSESALTYKQSTCPAGLPKEPKSLRKINRPRAPTIEVLIASISIHKIKTLTLAALILDFLFSPLSLGG